MYCKIKCNQNVFKKFQCITSKLVNLLQWKYELYITIFYKYKTMNYTYIKYKCIVCVATLKIWSCIFVHVFLSPSISALITKQETYLTEKTNSKVGMFLFSIYHLFLQAWLNLWSITYHIKVTEKRLDIVNDLLKSHLKVVVSLITETAEAASV